MYVAIYAKDSTIPTDGQKRWIEVSGPREERKGEGEGEREGNC